MKKWLLPSILVIIVAAAAFYMLTEKKTETASNEQEQEVFDPQNPNFILGQVVSASAGSMEIKSGAETYTVAIGSETKLSKQTKLEGILVQVDAVPADFTPESTVVVYYSEGSGAENLSANTTPTKIQIITQP